MSCDQWVRCPPFGYTCDKPAVLGTDQCVRHGGKVSVATATAALRGLSAEDKLRAIEASAKEGGKG